MSAHVRWIDKRALVLLHNETLAEHGGLAGLLEEEVLDAALARPKEAAAHGDRDLAFIAAVYGVELAKAHPFADGNKRAVFLAVGLFLALNGFRLAATQAEAIHAMLAVTSGVPNEAPLASWLRKHMVARG